RRAGSLSRHGLGEMAAEVREVPVHGLLESGLKALTRLPAELAPDPRDVHRIAPVVAGPVGDERNEVGVRPAPARPRLVEQRAERLHHLVVRALAFTADVVGLPQLAFREPDAQRLAVI